MIFIHIQGVSRSSVSNLPRVQSYVAFHSLGFQLRSVHQGIIGYLKVMQVKGQTVNIKGIQ